MSEQCSICKEALDDTSPVYSIPECSHRFHTNCIMTWFRCGHNTCPLCLNKGVNSRPKATYHCMHEYAFEMYKELRQESRKNGCCAQLKKSVKQLKRYENKLVQLKKQKKEFLENTCTHSVKKILRIARRFEQEVYKLERCITRKKISIGMSYKRILIPVKTKT